MAELSKVITVGAGSGTASFKTSTGQSLPVAVLTELSVERSWTTKELADGDKLDPLDVALTDRKVTLKAKCNAMYAAQLGAMVGGTVTTGGSAFADETVTLSASVHTFTTTHSAATPVDRGVILANGKVGKLVSATPAVGEYTFAAGVWTFHNDEAGLVHCMCSYTDPTLITITEGAATVGDPTYIEVVAFVTYKGTNKKGLYFPKVMVNKVSEAAKSKEHTTYDVDMTAYYDTTTSCTCKTTFNV